MTRILRGVRPLDYVLAALFSAAGVFLMGENITAAGDSSLPHPVSTTSWVIVPVFLLVTLPILFRRRHLLAVVGVTTAATAVHVLAFGYLTRCGVVLPLAAALAYATGRFARGRRDHLLALAGILVLLLVTLVRDSSIGTVLEALPIAIPAAALFYGIGFGVQNRLSRKQSPAAPVAERATV